MTKSEPKLIQKTAPTVLAFSRATGERILTDSAHPQPRALT